MPEDADCLLINAPSSDISEAERDAILEYLQAGGRLILLTSPLQDGTELTNLEAVMEYYGVTAAEGIVVEGSQNNYIFPSPLNLLPEYGSHEITSPLSSGGYFMCLPLAQGLVVGEAPRDGVSVTELLTTSDEAFSKLSGYSMSTYEKEEGDLDGPFALAVAITETLDDVETQIIWVSSPTCLTTLPTPGSPAAMRTSSSTASTGSAEAPRAASPSTRRASPPSISPSAAARRPYLRRWRSSLSPPPS